ncbi:MAG: thioredoxin domain-containing protein, partial [Alphaproteobacteria bacterium]|nr:thioredoxin domain-containing protein [Alphaproteobacteria bacterium]
MQPVERNPRFSNPLAGSSSPYLRQHAHNPVFWYPWGEEAFARAREENKPILLSIGYSTCYWCHVMEREVFENLSIASLMNRICINIKVDREEHPHLDEIYMVARQLLTQEGGWPNNVFLTPDLRPFYAGGTYAATDAYGKPSFTRILEWVNYVWTTQPQDVLDIAGRITGDMKRFLVHEPAGERKSAATQAATLFSMLEKYHDGTSGGFFQAPKFPHECYLEFLLQYYRSTQSPAALDMVTLALSKMAAGGIYDHVGCGFHRYAVDKEWYVPHFEKMLYNQAQMARLYAEAAHLTGNPYFADIASSVLEFVGGPLTDGNGAFYSAIDAETDGVEGAYYAWSPKELQQILSEEEIRLLTSIYALADIPAFPGHKHVDGQVLIARKPLDAAARDAGLPYVQLAAVTGELMNRMLAARNQRKAPRLDDKIIVAWNGLMIDAFAHAGRLLQKPGYVARAREAADFLLEHAIDNNGRLHRIYAAGKAQHTATLEDYAFLLKGIISLHRAAPDAALLESAENLAATARELFADSGDKGYFLTVASADVIFRVKSADDSAIPGTNGVMLHNLIDLHAITGKEEYKKQAQAMADFFLREENVSVEHCTMLAAALRLEQGAAQAVAPQPLEPRWADDAVSIAAELDEVSTSSC